MLDKLESIEKRYEELHNLMADSAITTDPTRLRDITRELSGIEGIVEKFRAYRKVHDALDKTRVLVKDEPDEEMRAFAKEEVTQLEAEDARMYSEL
ncbi:partial Peptide chain release factor 1, partial [Anaerolineae bacterium]